jgi:hypothetical protein
MEIQTKKTTHCFGRQNGDLFVKYTRDFSVRLGVLSYVFSIAHGCSGRKKFLQYKERLL